nr:hypothetical protein HK105_006426 [Polyrhizophydium stewartii]
MSEFADVRRAVSAGEMWPPPEGWRALYDAKRIEMEAKEQRLSARLRQMNREQQSMREMRKVQVLEHVPAARRSGGMMQRAEGDTQDVGDGRAVWVHIERR